MVCSFDHIKISAATFSAVFHKWFPLRSFSVFDCQQKVLNSFLFVSSGYSMVEDGERERNMWFWNWRIATLLKPFFWLASCWYMIDFTRDIRVWMKIINGISLIEFSLTRSQWLHSSFSSNWYSMLFHARNSTEIETTLENETPHHSDIYATLAPCIPPYLSFYEEKLHLNHHCSYQIEYSELEMFFFCIFQDFNLFWCWYKWDKLFL